MPALPKPLPWYREIWSVWACPLLSAACTPALFRIGWWVALLFWVLEIYACVMLVLLYRRQLAFYREWEQLREQFNKVAREL
jgi:hypothetical protein